MPSLYLRRKYLNSGAIQEAIYSQPAPPPDDISSVPFPGSRPQVSLGTSYIGNSQRVFENRLTHKSTVIQNKKVNELTEMMNHQRVRVE